MRLGRISKQGNRMLRRLFVNGAMAALFRSKEVRADPWVIGLRGRKPMLVTAVALANKMARAVWSVMRRGTAWEPRLANPTAALAAVQA